MRVSSGPSTWMPGRPSRASRCPAAAGRARRRPRRSERGHAGRVGVDRRVDHLVDVALGAAFLEAPPVGVLLVNGLHVGLARPACRAPCPWRFARTCPPSSRSPAASRAVLLAPRLAHDGDRADVSSSTGLGPGVVNSTVKSSILFGMPGRVGVARETARCRARALEREHDVVGGERRAVVELHARGAG